MKNETLFSCHKGFTTAAFLNWLDDYLSSEMMDFPSHYPASPTYLVEARLEGFTR